MMISGYHRLAIIVKNKVPFLFKRLENTIFTQNFYNHEIE